MMTPEQELTAFRECISEAHGAMKDLGFQLKEVKAERRAITELLGEVKAERLAIAELLERAAAKAAFEAAVSQQVEAGLAEMSTQLGKTVRDAQSHIFGLFEALTPDKLVEAKLDEVVRKLLFLKDLKDEK